MRLFIGLARRLWMIRNNMLHGGSFVPPAVIFNQANRALEEFKVTQAEGPTNLPSTVIGVLSRWKAPSPRWVKINWDAALNSKGNRQGGGMMIWDCARNVLAVRCFSHGGTSSPTVVESLAALVAIDLYKDRGFTHVHLEGDSKNLVDAVNGDAADWSLMGHVVEDIKIGLWNFTQRKMSFIKREGNQVAHLLAKFAIKNGVYIVRSESPYCICEIVLLEQFALAQ
jgi:ribonuclease HI